LERDLDLSRFLESDFRLLRYLFLVREFLLQDRLRNDDRERLLRDLERERERDRDRDCDLERERDHLK